MWRRASLSSFCALALWIGGCPKRQGPSRIVFVPAHAPQATTAPAENAQVLVIEEPAPVEEEPVSPPPTQTAEPKTPAKSRPRVRTDAAPADDSAAPDASLPPPVEVPALEPRESTAQAAALRQRVQQLQDDVRQRLARVNESRLTANERKTLDDARTFFAQSGRALDGGDLQRAFNLVRKASLLIAALE